MGFGIEILADDFTQQIDADYRCVAFKQKGTATCTGDPGGATTMRYAQVTVTSSIAPMVAIRPTNTGQPIVLWGVSVSGSTWTFNYLGPSGASFDYYVFDYQGYAAPGSKIGMELYNASGFVTFSSPNTQMRVVGGGIGVSSLSYPDVSRAYGAMQTAPGFQQTWTEIVPGTVQYRAQIHAISRSASGMSLGLTNYELNNVAVAETDTADPSPFILMVDVTNL